MAEHVADDDGRTEIEARADAVDRYDALAADTDQPVPVGIREAMTNWDFDEADTMLTAAESVVAERERIVGDDPERAADEALTLGSAWAQAESADDLAAVQTSLLDRESELERNGLLRILIIVGAAALALGALVAAVLWRRGRSGGSTSDHSVEVVQPGPVVDGSPGSPVVATPPVGVGGAVEGPVGPPVEGQPPGATVSVPGPWAPPSGPPTEPADSGR